MRIGSHDDALGPLLSEECGGMRERAAGSERLTRGTDLDDRERRRSRECIERRADGVGHGVLQSAT